MMKGKSSNFLKSSLCTNSHSFYLKLLTVEFQTFMHLTFWTFVLKLFLYIPKSVIFWIVSSPFALNNSVVKTFLSKILHFLPVYWKYHWTWNVEKRGKLWLLGKYFDVKLNRIMYGREGAEWGRGYLQTEIDHVRIIILGGWLIEVLL